MIVVALHVLVIGGIFVFEGCSRTKAPTPDMASNESQPGQPPTMATAPDTGTQPMPQGMTPAIPQPTVTTAAIPAATPASKTYVVRKGDSLWKIAKLESVSVGDLSRANNLSKTSTLQIGQKLQIPASARTETTTATASVIPTGAALSSSDMSAPVDASGNLYTVQSGDSLWKIARRQSVTVASLKQANNLTSDSLKIGQRLHIPAPAAANTMNAGIATQTSWLEPGKYTENGQIIHIVDMNETPAIIAKKYGVKTDDLMKANNITDPTKLAYGQRLIIPSGTPVAAAVTTVAPAPAPVTTTPTVSGAPSLAAPVVSASQVTVQ